MHQTVMFAQLSLKRSETSSGSCLHYPGHLNQATSHLTTAKKQQLTHEVRDRGLRITHSPPLQTAPVDNFTQHIVLTEDGRMGY